MTFTKGQRRAPELNPERAADLPHHSLQATADEKRGFIRWPGPDFGCQRQPAHKPSSKAPPLLPNQQTLTKLHSPHQ